MEDLIEKNMGLVLTVVNRFNPKDQNEKEAYIQAGRIGLWKAINKFSETGGSKFSPYAWNPIKWEIIKEIRSHEPKTKHKILKDSEKCFYETDKEYVVIQKQEGIWESLPNTLTDLEEEIVLLKFEQGYNFKEISSKLNHHRSSIKKIFDSALEKIKESNL
tara:strand:+ start:80 stop:562 length:483 start_codon:yes stop_codon:yes gene_type:complete